MYVPCHPSALQGVALPVEMVNVYGQVWRASSINHCYQSNEYFGETWLTILCYEELVILDLHNEVWVGYTGITLCVCR